MKSLISILSFVLLAMIAWWSIIGDYDSALKDQSTAKPDYIEAFMNDFVITSMDEQGKPRYVIEGKYLEKRNNSDDTLVESPVFYLEHETPWKVVADNAILNDDNEMLYLNKNVVMQQQNADPGIVIHTTSMTIDTRTQLAYTNAPVTIIQGSSKLDSVGFRFNNITSEMELTSDVHGHFFPDEQ
jgi:lipopolysaccharide export system protein LptC